MYWQWFSPAPGTLKDCTNIGLILAEPGPGEEGGGTPGAGNLQSMHVLAPYPGRLTFSATQSVETFEMTAPNAIVDQPVDYTDLIVTSKFDWTDGTINSTDHAASVYLVGAQANITPSNQGTVTTGSTLVFEADTTSTGTVGAVGVFNPGTVEFTGGYGVNIGEFCFVTIAPVPQATVTWKASKGYDAGGMYRLAINGTCTVTNDTGALYAQADLAMPVVVDGGLLDIQKGVGTNFSGYFVQYVLGIPIPTCSVLMYSGTIKLTAPSTLGATKGVLMTGGVLQVSIPGSADAGEEFRRGTINGSMAVSGGAIKITYGNSDKSGLAGFLSATKDVTWSGGEYVPWIDRDQHESRSVWRTDGKFTISGDAKVSPHQLNPLVVPPADRRWTVIHGNGGLTGLPQVASAGSELVAEQNGNPVDQIRLKKN